MQKEIIATGFIIFLALLSVSFAGAEELDPLDYEALKKELTGIMRPQISPECQAQVVDFYGMTPEENVKEYCGGVKTRLIIILVSVMSLLIIEPFVSRQIRKTIMAGKQENFIMSFVICDKFMFGYKLLCLFVVYLFFTIFAYHCLITFCY